MVDGGWDCLGEGRGGLHTPYVSGRLSWRSNRGHKEVPRMRPSSGKYSVPSTWRTAQPITAPRDTKTSCFPKGQKQVCCPPTIGFRAPSAVDPLDLLPRGHDGGLPLAARRILFASHSIGSAPVQTSRPLAWEVICCWPSGDAPSIINSKQ